MPNEKALIIEFFERIGWDDTQYSFEECMSSAAIMVAQLATLHKWDVDAAVESFVKHTQGAYDRGFDPEDFIEDIIDSPRIEEYNQKYFGFDLSSKREKKTKFQPIEPSLDH
ncbi:hypothetical protein [Marinoscillum sp.]|uniref:hypothetical protein n=1 Tax=Marinoscillum sp. TaxID=2024838 RepID=UPI003BA97CC6